MADGMGEEMATSLPERGRRFAIGGSGPRLTGACAALLAASALLAVASTAASGRGAAAERPKLHKVTVGSNFYAPARLRIKRGDRVRWIWKASSDRHDVYVQKGPERFHSPTQSSGRYTRKFRKTGTFRLYCTQHTMFMTLTVRK